MEHHSFVAIQLVASGLLVLLQLSTMPVFLIYPELRRRILYRIMLSIALSDFLQLFAIFLFTFYEFIGWEYSKWTEKFFSGVFIIAWDHLIVQHFLLAINRLIIIVRAYYSPTSYKHESRMENGAFNFLLLLSWLLLAILQMLFMTPLCSGIWDSDAVGFFYEHSLPCSELYRVSELYFTIAFPAISICCYVAIIGVLRKARNIGTAKLPNGLLASNHVTLNSQEKRILLISILLFTIITALIFAWFINYASPPWTMLFCGYLLLNSCLTLTMNSEYRQRFLHMWRAILHPLMPCLVGIEPQNNRVIDVRSQMKSSTNNSGGALFIRRADPTKNTGQNSGPKPNNMVVHHSAAIH